MNKVLVGIGVTLGFVVGAVLLQIYFDSGVASTPSTASAAGDATALVLKWAFVLGLIALAIALGVVGYNWLMARVRPAAATAAAGTTPAGFDFKMPKWLIVAVLIALVLVFRNELLALFPPGTQVRLVAFMDSLLNNWVLAGLIIAAVLLLLKQRTAAILVTALVLLAFFFMPDTSGLSRSERFYTYLTTPAPRLVPTRREEVLPANTSRDCPGTLLGPFRLSTAEVQFNPKGCYFYAKGNGTVKFTGLYFGDLTVDLRTGAGDSPAHSKVYAVRAAHTPVEWQYILCSAPKKDMSTLDCK